LVGSEAFDVPEDIWVVHRRRTVGDVAIVPLSLLKLSLGLRFWVSSITRGDSELLYDLPCTIRTEATVCTSINDTDPQPSSVHCTVKLGRTAESLRLCQLLAVILYSPAETVIASLSNGGGTITLHIPMQDTTEACRAIACRLYIHVEDIVSPRDGGGRTGTENRLA
jgi:hypothetical protein